jgi:hypothetical protein
LKRVRDQIYLSRKIEFAVKWLKVLDRLASNHFLVQPNLMVCCCSGQ